MSQDGQRVALLLVFLHAGEIFLSRQRVAQEESSSFRKGPREMGGPDGVAGGAHPCACGCFRTLDQATIGDAVLAAGKRADVMDFGEQPEVEDFANAGYRLE